MDYVMLRSAITKAFQQSGDECPRCEPLISSLAYEKQIVRKAYSMLILPNPMDMKVRAKWEQKLNIQLSIKEFNALFLNARFLTLIGKYRSFQFRLLHRSIITNVDLHRWKLKENPDCYYCELQPETLEHLFWQCPTIKGYWHKLKGWITVEYQVDCGLSCKKVMFNLIIKNPNHVVNFICLMFKQYIYKQRCLKKAFNFAHFTASVQLIRNSEKYYAITKGNINKHYKKWFPATHKEEMYRENIVQN